MGARIRQGREGGFRNSSRGDGVSRKTLGTSGIWKERERKELKDSSKNSSLGDSEIPGESDLRGRECGKLGVGEEIQLISSVWGH